MRNIFTVGALALLIGGILPIGLVNAQQDSSSSNYELDEAFIGPGGTRDSGSDNYDLEGTLGDIGTGQSESGNYNLLAGFTTDAEPTLLFYVDGSTVDLGLLEPSSTKTGTATFSVGTYNAQGYVVQTMADPPTNSGYSLESMSSPAAPTAGEEQFGINLVANTSPTTFGSDPVQIPDDSFSYGQVANGYNTANQFQYNVGDIVAESYSSSGQTDYTVSYTANVSNITPGGQYQMDHVLVAVSTF